MVKGKTSTKFAFEVDEEHLKNVEFLEEFAKMHASNDMSATFAVIQIVLGDQQKKAPYDHCRNEKGMVPIEAVTAELTDIFTAMSEANATKN